MVNGWWIQPDCNLPNAESFAKQSEIGGRFFKEAMGIEVTVGYNVDSFRHAAMLPVCRPGGKDSYVFIAPASARRRCPPTSSAGEARTAEVLAFRAANYGAASVFDVTKNLETEVAGRPAGVGHTMCFYGIGDHGGGPNARPDRMDSGSQGVL